MLTRRALLRAGASTAVIATAGGIGAAGVVAAGPGIDWERLRRSMRGDVVLPNDNGYGLARQSHFVQFDNLRPKAVAFCETTEDVQAALRFARDYDLRTAPRSGGHSYGGYSTTDGVILDVSRLNHTSVGTSTVTVGPGAQQVDALTAVSPYGLSLVSGLCPTVCPGGFLQGGGIGWQTRKFGLAADQMVAAEIVLADGRVVTCSEQQHPDMFWALRGGGGGNFGVVTQYQVRPIQAPTMVNYNLTFPWESAPALLAAWQDWMIGGDRNLGGALGLQWTDAGTGRPEVLVYGGYLGTKAGLERQLAALEAAAGTPPATKAVEELPYFDAMMQWYGCADLTVDQCHRLGYTPEAMLPRQTFFLDRSRLVSRKIPAAGVDDLVTAFTANPRAGQFRFLSVFAVGGAVNDLSRTATAYVHRTSELYLAYAVGLAKPDATEEDRAAATNWVSGGFNALDPYSNGEGYQNFIDPLLPDWRSAYYAENYRALVAVKRTYDPDHFFHFAQGIS